MEIINESKFNKNEGGNIPIGTIISSVSMIPPSGWLLIGNNSIGSTTSSAVYKGDKYFQLYKLLWELPGLTVATSSTNAIYLAGSSKGSSALADWNNNKIIKFNFYYNETYLRQGVPNSGTSTISGYKDIVGSFHTCRLISHCHTMTHCHTASMSTSGYHYHWSGFSDGKIWIHTCYGGARLIESGSGYCITDPPYLGGTHSHTVTINSYSGYTAVTGVNDNTPATLAINFFIKY